MMNYNHLYYFYVTVREGSVSGASRFLRVSQPAVSSQIRSLEGSLGVQLFERRGKRLILTSPGRSAYGYAAQMFDLSAGLLDSVKNQIVEGTPIKLGVADEVERPFAVNLVKFLFKGWKDKQRPRVFFSTGRSSDLLVLLRKWEVDGVMTNRPTSFEDLEIMATLPMPMFLVLPAAGAKLRHNSIACTPRDIGRILQGAGAGLVLPSDQLKLRDEIDDFLSKLRRTQQIVFESDTIAAVIRAILDDVGMGFVPLPYIVREVAKKELAIFGPPDGLWKHVVYFMVKREKKNSAAVLDLCEAFENLRKEVNREVAKIHFSSGVERFFKI